MGAYNPAVASSITRTLHAPALTTSSDSLPVDASECCLGQQFGKVLTRRHDNKRASSQKVCRPNKNYSKCVILADFSAPPTNTTLMKINW